MKEKGKIWKRGCGAITLSITIMLFFICGDNVWGECINNGKRREVGVLGGYGYNFPVSSKLFRGKNVSDDVRSFFIIPYIGIPLKEWSRCKNLQFNVEGFLNYAIQEGDKKRYAIGLTPFLQFNLGDIHKIAPFIGIGSGILYTDLNPEGLGSRFNFTPQIGIGIRYNMDKRYLILSYRYHHISNAGTKSPNESIDSNFFIIGLTIPYK